MKKLSNYSEFKESIQKTYNAIEFYITLVPLKNEELFTEVYRIEVEPFTLLDGWGKLTISDKIDELYVHVLETSKSSGDLFSEYHNLVRDYNNYKDVNKIVRSSDGGAKSYSEYYWEIIYDKDHNEIVIPYGYDDPHSRNYYNYIPDRIKEIISYLTKEKPSNIKIKSDGILDLDKGKSVLTLEFWEWQKNYYGEIKDFNDSLKRLVQYNSQNGYTEEGQWTMTTFGDVYIEEIQDGNFIGTDRYGNKVEGKSSDIIRTITKKEILKEYLQGLHKIGYGTEGEVFSDGKYAYKVVPSDMVGDLDYIKKHVGKDYPNVVKIYDAWKLSEKDIPQIDGYYPDNDYTVIKMELLDDLPDVEDDEEFMRVRDLLWYSQDDQSYVENIKSSDPEVQKMLDAIVSAKDHVGYLDIGFHNLMYDSKTGEYKQIDIF